MTLMSSSFKNAHSSNTNIPDAVRPRNDVPCPVLLNNMSDPLMNSIANVAPFVFFIMFVS